MIMTNSLLTLTQLAPIQRGDPSIQGINTHTETAVIPNRVVEYWRPRHALATAQVLPS